jgi:hypothetical protein
MYILTKRATDGVQVWHKIHGTSVNPSVARAWYRSTRTTDVFEIDSRMEERGGWSGDVISEKQLESWREQHTREEKERAKCQTQSA